MSTWFALETDGGRRVVMSGVDAARASALQPAREVQHQHVAALLAIVRDFEASGLPAGVKLSGGSAVVVAEYVPGGTLARKLTEKRFGPADAVAHALKLLSAVEALHARGVVHGAISPWAIVTEPEPRRDGPVLLQLMAPPVGPYCPPERLKGATPASTDDVWALYATLYAMLTGKSPFIAADREVLSRQMLASRPKPLSQYGVDDPVLGEILLRGLTGEKRLRAADLAELRAVLENWQRDPRTMPRRRPAAPRAAGSLDFAKPAPSTLQDGIVIDVSKLGTDDGAEAAFAAPAPAPKPQRAGPPPLPVGGVPAVSQPTAVVVTTSLGAGPPPLPTGTTVSAGRPPPLPNTAQVSHSAGGPPPLPVSAAADPTALSSGSASLGATRGAPSTDVVHPVPSAAGVYGSDPRAPQLLLPPQPGIGPTLAQLAAQLPSGATASPIPVTMPRQVIAVQRRLSFNPFERKRRVWPIAALAALGSGLVVYLVVSVNNGGATQAAPAPSTLAAPTKVAAPERSRISPVEERNNCVRSYFPERELKAQSDFGFVCEDSDFREVARHLFTAAKQAPMLKSSDHSAGAVAAAKADPASSGLGWYELPAAAIIRKSCCTAASSVTLPQTVGWCEQLQSAVRRIADDSGKAGDLSPSARAFDKAVRCLFVSAINRPYVYARSPSDPQRRAFQLFLSQAAVSEARR